MITKRQEILAARREAARPTHYYGTRIVFNNGQFIYFKSLDEPEITFDPAEPKYRFYIRKQVSDHVMLKMLWPDVSHIEVKHHEITNNAYLEAKRGFIIQNNGNGYSTLVEPEIKPELQGFKVID